MQAGERGDADVEDHQEDEADYETHENACVPKLMQMLDTVVDGYFGSGREHTRGEVLISLKQSAIWECDVLSFCECVGGQVALEVEVEGLFEQTWRPWCTLPSLDGLIRGF